jgi:hypothetical protein
MGRFYTNITLSGPSGDAVASALRGRNLRAVVTPTVNAKTVVFDAASESQDGGLYELAAALSLDLACVAFAVANHDDSVLYFRVFDNGELIDSYDSCPSYFQDIEPLPPTGGKADLLCGLFGQIDNAGQVEDILRFDALADEEAERYVFESERHADLSVALGLSHYAVGFGFEAIMTGDLPKGLNMSDCSVLTP